MADATKAGGWREWVFLKRRRLVAVAAVLALAGAAVEDTSWLVGQGWWIWAQVCGFGLIGYGEGLRFWATAHIGGRKSQAVVESGPYAWSRNPLYLGSLLCVAGIALLAASVLGFVTGVCALAFIYGATIRHEENFLRQHLGEPYEAYMLRVPRFWPRRKAGITSQAPDQHRAPVRVLLRESYTGFGFVVAGVVAMFLQQLVAQGQSEGLLPVLFAPGWLFAR